MKNLAMPTKTQGKAWVFSEFRQAWSVTLTHKWVDRVMQKSLPYETGILRWEQAIIEYGNVDHREGKERYSKIERAKAQVR